MTIPYGRHSISPADRDAVLEVLNSDFLTQGPMIPRFEQALADYCKSQYAIVTTNATAALHIACLALDVGPGDLVWTSPITFVASANCALYCGAEVDFVDIDPNSYNMSVSSLANKLAAAKVANRLPKVVIPVHLCGQPCEMQEIYALSLQYGFRIIEDASHAIGGLYKNAPIGNCAYSDITIFSFHPVKIITTGEGGAALTNDLKLAKRLTSLRSHGITRDAAEMTHPSEGPWYYQQLELGFNYRMTDLQAALGLSQLQRLDAVVARRHVLAQRYNELFASINIKQPWQHPDSYSGMHLYIIRLLDAHKSYHRRVFENLREAEIGVNLHYIPVYRQPYYARLGFNPEDFPEAEKYGISAITLPLYPELTDTQQVHIANSVLRAINE
jgi:UDP-4-amino-4,6-dideoxy-N-acetyl-beta-L-altrosamine transaminase